MSMAPTPANVAPFQKRNVVTIVFLVCDQQE
jgi:hypothetical protein